MLARCPACNSENILIGDAWSDCLSCEHSWITERAARLRMAGHLSPASWKAAQLAAERAIPVLMAKGRLPEAALLSRKAKQFAERAEA